jgi:hypothetical protein
MERTQTRKNIPSKDKILLNEMRRRKAICVKKLKKISDRIAILESYKKQPISKRVDLKTFLKRKGINYKDFFAPMGYYCGAEKVVSNDRENQKLEYWKGMVYDDRVGYHTPKKSIVTNDDHNEVVKSQLGMTWNPKLNLYFPTVNYNADTYAISQMDGDSGMDIMGGLISSDFGGLNARTEDGEIFLSFVKDLLEEEFDSVSEEFDLIEGSEIILEEKLGYNSAEGEENLSKKEKRKNKRADRKQDRKDRKETRKEFRSGKKDCKSKYKDGKISKEDYKKCLKTERSEKKEKLQEQGGTLVARVLRGQSFVNPMSYIVRGSVLILIDANVFAFATRLAPALLPENEAKEKFTPQSIEKAKKGWKKIKNSWFQLGGDTKKLQGAIIKGYKKRPYKVKGKSGFEGEVYDIELEQKSNFVEPATVGIITAVTTGLGTLSTLIASLNKSGVDKNPYKEGQEPEGFKDDLKALGKDPIPDPNTPQIDEKTGKWVEPSTGREIDPLTGKYKDTIFGLNKWVAIGLGFGALAGIYYLTKKK